MYLVNILRNLLLALFPVAITLSTYIYLYPLFHQCAFPNTGPSAERTSYVDTLLSHITRGSREDALPTFRLLALGDPQLEGDTSIPDASFPHWGSLIANALNKDDRNHSPLQRLRHSLHDIVDLILDDVPWWLEGYRKRVDLFGNDYYLAHIYRTLHWWAKPTHISVLGDLLGSQWIDDDEFQERSDRFWSRVFKDGTRLNDELMTERPFEERLLLTLGEDKEAWSKKIINIAGNHDIGYAGDLDEHRIERFEKQYGKVNYELWFQLPRESYNTTTVDERGQTFEREVPELRIIVLNSMNLDAPVGKTHLQDETYRFLNHIISTSSPVERDAHFTLLLTHIPMYKEEGVCVDAPFFDFWNGEYGNGIREQNHLSDSASQGIMEGIYGMSSNPTVDGRGSGRKGLVINGHDHEGCDTYHYIEQPPQTGTSPAMPISTEEPSDLDSSTSPNPDSGYNVKSNPLKHPEPPSPYWQAVRTPESLPLQSQRRSGIPGIREVTLRAMMGDFGGNAGLLSLDFNTTTWEWEYAFENCALGTQHLWWATHIIDLIAFIGLVIYGVWTCLIGMEFVGKGEFDLFGVPSTARRNVIKGKDGKMSVGRSNGHLVVPENTEAKKSLRKKKSRTKVNGSINGNGAANGQERRSLSAVFEKPSDSIGR